MINRRPNRPRTLLILLAGALLVALAVAAVSAALPGDPPITNQAPANGASVPAVAEGLTVTFTCPAYRTAEVPVEFEEGEEEEGETKKEKKEREKREEEEREQVEPVFGGSEEYGVNFSTSPALGKDGRLTTAGFGEAGEGESEAIKGTASCTSELELPTVPNPAVLYSGRVYWQAYRECEGCASGYETGPVSSFNLFPYVEEGEINFPNHIFGDYLTKVSFFAEAELKGATVQLQEWDGSAWTTIAAEPGAASGENAFFVKLQPGHRLLRPVIVGVGSSLILEAKSRLARKAQKSPPAAVKSGTWVVAGAEEQQEYPLTFKVTDGGTKIRAFTAAAEAFCRGVNKTETATIESTAAFPTARIAPDGSVTAHHISKGATPTLVNVTGNFFNGRFTGEINSAFLNCKGFRQFEAVPQQPKPPKKK